MEWYGMVGWTPLSFYMGTGLSGSREEDENETGLFIGSEMQFSDLDSKGLNEN